jgi:tetratricopeptide (TPR) repeat protein
VDRLYSLTQASHLLGIPRRLVTGLVDAGLVAPLPGPRGQPRFGFRELVALRAAQGLADSGLPPARIARALKRLREQLPGVAPQRLKIEAMGRTIVVREGSVRWAAESGQYLLAFEVMAEGGELHFIARDPPAAASQDWFARGLALEERAPKAAVQAYRRAIEHDASCCAAYANLGRLLHAAGQHAKAQAIYEAALRQGAIDATLLFNFAVLLEDRGRLDAAEQRYREALANDPALADAHCNLGLLYERIGDARGALRHLSAYRQLVRDA